MRHRLKKIRISLFVLFSIILSGCSTIYNPATEQNEILFIDTESEVALGKDIDAGIKKELPLLQDAKMQARLDRIGNRVGSISDRTDLVYHFRIAKDDEFNAFALPGGFVYVNSGLIKAATDDELAAVIAHEIGHIAARHSIKKLQATLGYQLIMGIALGISGQRSTGQAIDVVFNLVSLGYSRKDEFLADKLAVKYAKRSGFNPYGMVTFFEKLKKEADEKGPNFKLVFLSSHPPIEQRIEKAKEEITKQD